MTPDDLKKHGLRVKPLDWVQSGGSHVLDGESHTVPGGYTVRYADENGWKWQASGIGAYGWELTPRLAKAAAQADHAARIAAALEPIAPPDVAQAARPLASLLAAVEAGDFDATPERPTPKFNAFCNAWESAFGVGVYSYQKAWTAYATKDVNAAIALCKAMMPGWRWGIRSHDSIEGDGFFAWLNSPDYKVLIWIAGDQETTDVLSGLHTSADADTPSRAILIAMLRAMVAREGTP